MSLAYIKDLIPNLNDKNALICGHRPKIIAEDEWAGPSEETQTRAAPKRRPIREAVAAVGSADEPKVV